MVDFGQSRVDRLILFRSELSPKGARYTPLIEPPLSGGSAPFPVGAK
jgi:2'-5' RNA ligase